MRILYGVTGCGLGHTMRSRALAKHLIERGHTVKLAASGRAVDILRRQGLDVLGIDGMTMHFEGGGVERVQTLLRLLGRAPRALAHNVAVALGDLRTFAPELVVTDFDSFAHTVGLALRVPVISVDHQHVLDRFHHPRDVRRSVTSFRLARAVVTAKTPACERYIVSSFFFPEARARRETTLVGPIVRPEIERAVPTRGDHVLVYQTAAGDPALLPALAALPRQRFVVYGLSRDEARANVELRSFDEARFVEDLASSRAVVANGGFTTLSEAIYLGKPVLSVPVTRQPEQELNAAYVARAGYGLSARKISPALLRRLLAFLPAPSGPREGRIRRGTRDASAALNQALLEAA